MGHHPALTLLGKSRRGDRAAHSRARAERTEQQKGRRSRPGPVCSSPSCTCFLRRSPALETRPDSSEQASGRRLVCSRTRAGSAVRGQPCCPSSSLTAGTPGPCHPPGAPGSLTWATHPLASLVECSLASSLSSAYPQHCRRRDLGLGA